MSSPTVAISRQLLLDDYELKYVSPTRAMRLKLHTLVSGLWTEFVRRLEQRRPFVTCMLETPVVQSGPCDLSVSTTSTPAQSR